MIKRNKKALRSKRPKVAVRGPVKEDQQGLRAYVDALCQPLRDRLSALEGRVAKSNDTLLKNQQNIADGMRLAEEHIVLLRRVLNDALGGVTRVTKIDRVGAEDLQPVDKVQVIDWGWYGEQLHFCDDAALFMNGAVLSPKQIALRASTELSKRRRSIVLYAASQAAEKDEAALREAYEAGGLEELLKRHIPEKIVWEEPMAELAPDIVAQVLRQREQAQKLRQTQQRVQERAMLKAAVVRAAAVEGADVLKDVGRVGELVRGILPAATPWTVQLAQGLEEVIAEVLEQREQNGPQQMQEAAQVLLEETREFGAAAQEVIGLIQSGNQEEAQVKMAELEKKVKDKEAEADSNAPYIPEGAAIFGGP